MNRRKRFAETYVHWFNPVKRYYRCHYFFATAHEFSIISPACQAQTKKMNCSSSIDEITCPRCRAIFIQDGGQATRKIRIAPSHDELGPEDAENLARSSRDMAGFADYIKTKHIRDGVELSDIGKEFLAEFEQYVEKGVHDEQETSRTD